ncbi:MAG: flagellar hook protein FlgE [Gammaproteobacteria bacterium]|nr:flagellar hook protein FlgE [Gammaproteobacteria bacterium]
MTFKTALSGLNAAQADLNVIGNNIANVSTFGFKKSRAEFVDVYAASYQGISRLAVGSGVRVAQVQQNMSQGGTTYTDNNLDLAVQGRGFFMVNDSAGQTYFTRNGMFAPDNQGNVVNSRGLQMQVYPANTDGTFNTGTTTGLSISTTEGPPSATTELGIGLNLNADDTLPTVGAFDRNNPLSYNYATSATVYDSLGSTHLTTTYYVKTAANSWDVYTTMTDPVDDVSPTIGDGFAQPANGAPTPFAAFAGDPDVIQGPLALVFTSNGTLDPAIGINGAAPLPIDYAYTIDNGATNMGFTIDFSKATQYSNDSGVSFLTQDGYATGLLTGVDVDDSGVVFANYTNGVSEPLGRIALANFQNPQGLQPTGDSLWLETFDSGENRQGEPGTGNLGLIQGGALEDSNVNLSEELVALIVAQRNFQANAQAITTENTVTQTIIQIR